MSKDWRGTEITEGALVIYGSGVGRSIQMNEAIVVSPSSGSGNGVKLRIVRRSYSSGTQPLVTVGADRLTVVESLAPCALPTQDEKALESHKRSLEWAIKGLAEAREGNHPTYWESQENAIKYHERQIKAVTKKIAALEGK